MSSGEELQGGIWDHPDAISDPSEKVAQLGPPQAEFSIGSAQFVWLLVASLFLSLGGLALTALSVALIIWGGHGGGAVVFKMLAAGIFMLVGGVFLSLRAYRNWGLRVLIYEVGLVRLQRSQASAFFWDEVETVWQKKHKGSLAKFTQGKLVYIVRRHNGEEFHFDDSLPEIQRLGSIIKAQTLPHLLARTRDAFHAGRQLDFNKVRVSRDGIGNGTETIPWEMVQQIQFEDERVTINRKGNWLAWFTGAASDIPNPHVFQNLLRELAPEKVVFK
jgi:hypothetical protein